MGWLIPYLSGRLCAVESVFTHGLSLNPHWQGADCESAFTDDDSEVQSHVPRPPSKYRKSSCTIAWTWSLQTLADEVMMGESQPHGWKRAKGLGPCPSGRARRRVHGRNGLTQPESGRPAEGWPSQVLSGQQGLQGTPGGGGGFSSVKQ